MNDLFQSEYHRISITVTLQRRIKAIRISPCFLAFCWLYSRFWFQTVSHLEHFSCIKCSSEPNYSLVNGVAKMVVTGH